MNDLTRATDSLETLMEYGWTYNEALKFVSKIYRFDTSILIDTHQNREDKNEHDNDYL